MNWESGGRWLGVVVALVVPAVVSANPLTGSILVDSGVQWWLAVNAAITLIEWPIFALSAKYNWALALPIALLANLASGLVGAVAGPFALFTTVPGFFVELLVAYGLVQGLQRVRVRAPVSVLIPVLLMNAATFWIGPALFGKLPVHTIGQAACLSHMKQMGNAIEAYAHRHNGKMPHVRSMHELRAALGGPVDEKLYHCPVPVGLQLTAPLTEQTQLILLLPWPDEWVDFELRSASGRVILADARPAYWKGVGVRTLLFADGHVKSVLEPSFQRILNSKDHTE